MEHTLFGDDLQGAVHLVFARGHPRLYGALLVVIYVGLLLFT